MASQLLLITMIMSFIVVGLLDSGGITGANVAYVEIHGIQKQVKNKKKYIYDFISKSLYFWIS